MSSFNNMLFGPLDRKYCSYFYYLTVIMFIFCILSILTFLYNGFTTKFDMIKFAMFLYMILLYGAFYIQNRILYSMCINSL